MSIGLFFFLLLPSAVVGQHVLDYTNEPLIYWVQVNNIVSLTTEYTDSISSYGRYEEKIKEELFFDSEYHKVNQFRSFRTIVDTSTFPQIQALLFELEPDTTYIDHEELTTEIYTTELGRCVKSYLLDANGVKIFEKIYPRGEKPIYMKFLQEDIQLNEGGNIEKHQFHRLFGWNDWEYYFDTASYRAISYNSDLKIVDSWEKETSRHHFDNTTKTTVKKNSAQRSIKYVDTLSLNAADLSNKTLQWYFETEELKSLFKISHPTYIEYLDSNSGVKLYLNPPFSRHGKFRNDDFAYQETIRLRDGLRLKNYLVTDTSYLLVEVINFDENERVKDFFQLGFDSQNEPSKWSKHSYQYLGSYPFIVTYSEHRQTKKNLKNPERRWFKKISSKNSYRDWLASSHRFIDDSNFELVVKNTKYLVIADK